MRIFCAFVCLFLLAQCFNSCQKQLHFEDLPAEDSVWLVKSALLVNYDANDVFSTQEKQTFLFDKTLNQTVVSIADSQKNGMTYQWNETFKYDAQNRLSQFTATGGYEAVSQIDFTYDAAGNISKAVMNNLWLGKTIACDFTTTTQNGQKLITMYDTSGLYNNNTDNRPQKTKFTFDAGNKLVRETIIYTLFKIPKNVFEDTTDIKLSYDNNNYVNKQVLDYAYRFSPVATKAEYARDSNIITREGNNIDVRNTFLKIYKNMYWFSISENSEGFANALNLGTATYTGPSIKSIENWLTYPPDPTILDHALGVFQNTFDSNGMLTKVVYPPKFSNSYYGKTEVYYTYTREKK